MSVTERFEIEHDYIEDCRQINTEKEEFESTHDYFEDAIFEQAWEEIEKDDELDDLMQTLHDEEARDRVELRQQDLDLGATLRRPLDRLDKDDDVFDGFQDDDDATYDFDDMDPFEDNTTDMNTTMPTPHVHHDFTQEIMAYVDHVVFVTKVLFTVQHMDENELTRHAEEICGSQHVSELKHLEDLEDEVTASTCAVKSVPSWLERSNEGILKALRHQHDLAVSQNSPRIKDEDDEENCILPLGIYVHVEKTFYSDCEDEKHIHNKFIFDCINEDLDRVLAESTSCATCPEWRRNNTRPALFPMLNRFSSDNDIALWLKDSFRVGERTCIRASPGADNHDELMRIVDVVNSEVQEFMRPGGMFWLRKDRSDFIEAGAIAEEMLDEMIVDML